jgi:hypothetical protein
MQGHANFVATLLLAAAACATPPESPGPVVAKTAPAPSAATAPEPEATTAAAPPAADAGTSDGCAEESETVPVIISTKHAGGKKGGFVAKMQAPLLKLNETLIDTTSLKGAYTCCVQTEVESVRFECELPDGPSIGRVYREKDELVIEPGEGHDGKRLPIPCGAWLRFRGPVKDCESSPP